MKESASRLISTYHPGHMIQTGVLIYSIMKSLVAFDYRIGGPFMGYHLNFCVGYNAEDLSLAYQMARAYYYNPIIIGIDNKRHDATVSKELLQFKLGIYHAVADGLIQQGKYTAEKAHEALDAVRQEARNTCVCRRKGDNEYNFILDVFYQDDPFLGTTGSGANDTSGGGDLVNTGGTIAVAGKHEGSMRMIFGKTDDTLVMFESSDFTCLDEICAAKKQLGLVPEVDEKTGDQAEFCSGVFIPVREYPHNFEGEVIMTKYLFTLKPGRALYKLGWTVKCLSKRKQLRWMMGVAQQAMHIYNHVPVLGLFAAKTYELCASAGVQPTRLDDGDRHKMLPTYSHESCPDTVEWFCERYSTSAAEIGQVVGLIEKIERLPAVLSHPLLERMVSFDN
jgi:hypothetical protein